MKRTLIASLALFALLTPFHAIGADKVGYINIQRIVSNSTMGKEAATEITRIREAENAKIKTMNESLNALKIQFRTERQKADANDGSLVSMLETIQLRDKQLKRFVDDAKESLAKKDRELVASILKRIDPILKKIAKKSGYTIVIKDANALAFLDPKADLSDEVVKKLNAETN